MSGAPIETTATELTPEMLDLFEHEKVIEQGLASFIDVGNSLIAIKADKKYRHVGYATFEDYCQQRWGITRERGRQLVVAATIVDAMPTTVGIPTPTRESQVRPLAAVPAEERADVWAEAVEAAGGDQPTARQVEEVVERRKPMPVPKPAATPAVTPGEHHADPAPEVAAVISHPATYPVAVMDIFRDIIPGGSTVLDPFAGVGTIHELRPDCETWGVEIEPEWGELGGEYTIIGDSTRASELLAGREFDVIATSPAYGNRLADAYYNAADADARYSYALDLGRPLTEGSGAALHFDTDGRYEELHAQVWYEVVSLLRPGGLFLLNCKDFQRDGRIMPVTGWHVGELAALGLTAIDLRTLSAAGLPFVTAKPLSEVVVVFRKGGAQ